MQSVKLFKCKYCMDDISIDVAVAFGNKCYECYMEVTSGHIPPLSESKCGKINTSKVDEVTRTWEK